MAPIHFYISGQVQGGITQTDFLHTGRLSRFESAIRERRSFMALPASVTTHKSCLGKPGVEPPNHVLSDQKVQIQMTAVMMMITSVSPKATWGHYVTWPGSHM